LQSCKKDLQDALQILDRIMYISTNLHNIPVAFASNALYVLERHGTGSREQYDNVIIPLLKAKIDYLHAEGVAQAVWGLASAEIYDKELWTHLAKAIKEKEFNYEVVKNHRYTASEFGTLTGTEHFFEREVNQISDKLFF
jgi:hypothetical protein